MRPRARLCVELSCAAAVACSALGCGPATQGEFTKAAFVNEIHGYQIEYADATSYALAGRDWSVESHSYCGPRPCSHKSSSEYVTELKLDLDDEGEEASLGEIYRYDVLLQHRNNFGRIWVKSEPLTRELAEKDLSALAGAIVEGIASLQYEATVDATSRKVEIREKRYATTLLDSKALGISGRPAQIALFDAAQVAQLQMSQQQRSLRVALVLIRTPYEFEVHTARGTKTLPVLITAAYANAPENFDAGFGDFQRLLSRIRL